MTALVVIYCYTKDHELNLSFSLQEPQYPLYLWSQLVKEEVIHTFSSDASDFVPKLEGMVSEWERDPLAYHKDWVHRLREFSKDRLTHHGVARSMAYALTNYAQKQLWAPKLKPGFNAVITNRYLFSTLPKPFVRKVKGKRM